MCLYASNIIVLTDRNVRIENMKASLKDLMAQNQKLRDQENILRTQYDKV